MKMYCVRYIIDNRDVTVITSAESVLEAKKKVAATEPDDKVINMIQCTATDEVWQVIERLL